MTINTNGRTNVTTPGTPVPLTTNHKLVANKLFFQAIPGLTGKTYVGIPSMSKSTLSGVARVETRDGLWLLPPQRAVWIPAGTRSS